MKKLAIILMFFIASSVVKAQSIEITPMIGYSFSGSINSTLGEYDVKDAVSYGVNVDFQIGRGNYLELSYKRTDPDAVYRRYLGERIDYDLGVEHYQIGGLREINNGGSFIPYAVASLGASRYYTKNTIQHNEEWLFSGSMGFGAKHFFTDKLGVKFQTNLILPMQFSGLGFFCGGGSGGAGCGGGASFYVPIVQWDLSAGLIYRI